MVLGCESCCDLLTTRVWSYAANLWIRLNCYSGMYDVQINEEFDSQDIIIQVYPSEVTLEGVLTRNQTTTYLQYMTSLYTQWQRA